MVGEVVVSGLGAIKTAFDIAKGLKDISDVSVRNAAVIELQERILAAQQAQSALTERIRQLEEEVAGHKAWDAEKNRYKLTDYGGGTFAYELKESEANGEPAHKLCAKCYQGGQKSILQFEHVSSNQQKVYLCQSCNKQLFLGKIVESYYGGPSGGPDGWMA
jgi:hypothetical protein